eukprot:CAMPEP_0196819648 /NCGR_PEP_ID=MMETSP1362-20130617/71514_1 /TAXON_ID=163516 /ORGANISM="Leptocylindrus danicus, Strain CCMP1856" /LENGTH=917 /DNA_ID=CAMNT_0042198211 /DNA_START=53 /DNA_END=2803 /DNA_ORIENTATION=+
MGQQEEKEDLTTNTAEHSTNEDNNTKTAEVTAEEDKTTEKTENDVKNEADEKAKASPAVDIEAVMALSLVEALDEDNADEKESFKLGTKGLPGTAESIPPPASTNANSNNSPAIIAGSSTTDVLEATVGSTNASGTSATTAYNSNYNTASLGGGGASSLPLPPSINTPQQVYGTARRVPGYLSAPMDSDLDEDGASNLTPSGFYARTDQEPDLPTAYQVDEVNDITSNHNDNIHDTYFQQHHDTAGSAAAVNNNGTDYEDPEVANNLATVLPVHATAHAEVFVAKPWYTRRRTFGSAALAIIGIIVAVVTTSIVSQSVTSRNNSSSSNESGGDGTNSDNGNNAGIVPSSPPSLSQIPSDIPSLAPTSYFELTYNALKEFFEAAGGLSSGSSGNDLGRGGEGTDDGVALSTFQSSQSQWINATGWTKSDKHSSVCTWYGVICNADQTEVIGLDLARNNLVGDITSVMRPILTIYTLQSVQFKNNRLSGNISELEALIVNSSSPRATSLAQMDLRYNLLDNVGAVSSSMCNAIEALYVDCDLECPCCDHQALCECVDVEGFVDLNGEFCDWYDETPSNCLEYGDLYSSSNMNMTANEACCSCNGGTQRNPSPSAKPSFFPSQQPSAEPSLSSMPTISLQPTRPMVSTEEALGIFYNELRGDKWKNSTNWLNTSVSYCHWYGVECILENNKEYLWLDLKDNGLAGSIPSVIGDMTNLKGLALDFNLNIISSIPSEIGYLTNLEYLGVRQNNLGSTIPTELSNLTSLKTLFAYWNKLSGTLPTELGQLTSLEYLWLHYNRLSGTVPTEVGLMKNLKEFDVPYQQISGTIPSEIGMLSSLEWLLLTYNLLMTGLIPSELGMLKSADVIILGYNQFSGTIPSELGSLNELFWLFLHNNDFSGDVPDEICALRDVNGGTLEEFW